jgi:hypothetical protein
MKLLLLLLLRFVVTQSAALDDSGGSTVAKKWNKDALSGSKDPVFRENGVGTGYNSKQGGGNGEILGENGDERSVCELPPVRGPCRATLPRYHYDSVSQTCQEFKYGGNNIFAILNSQENIR